MQVNIRSLSILEAYLQDINFFGIFSINTSLTNWTFERKNSDPLFRTFVMENVQTWQSHQIRIQLVFDHIRYKLNTSYLKYMYI